MFQGTIPKVLQQLIAEAVHEWDEPEVYVGTSGNFTIERVISHAVPNLHGNDVQLYSCALGWLFAGEDFRMEVKADEWPEWAWLSEYLTDPVSKAAVVLLSSRMLDGLGKKSAYYQRMQGGYRTQFPRLFAETVAKLEAADLHLASFYPGDVVEWVKEIPDSAPFVSFPPFWAGGYETMFDQLHRVFDWDQPTYEVLDDARMDLMVDRVQAHRLWIYGNNERRPDLEEHLLGYVRASGAAVPIWVYSNSAPRRVGLPPRKQAQPLLAPHLQPGEKLGDRLGLLPLTAGQFVTLRSHYLTHRLRYPADPSVSYAVTVDGVVVGAFGFQTYETLNHSRTPSDNLPMPAIYMMSDFCVTGTDYPRLSKLIVMAALSSESKLLAENSSGRRIRSLVTTAFSDRPVSMKYRGLMQLMGRREADRAEFAYQLQYGAPIGEWTLEEGYELWRTNHGSDSKSRSSTSET